MTVCILGVVQFGILLDRNAAHFGQMNYIEFVISVEALHFADCYSRQIIIIAHKS